MSVINLTSKDVILKNGSVYVNHKKTKGVPGMLLIHANYCHHCTSFKGTYEQLAKKLGNEFHCVAIENDEIRKGGDALATALDFRYFPTLKFYDHSGKIIGTYPESQQRDIDLIMKYICKMYHYCTSY